LTGGGSLDDAYFRLSGDGKPIPVLWLFLQMATLRRRCELRV